jgi:succinate dehydrogenase/fumarate reductase flavoprotein subunit
MNKASSGINAFSPRTEVKGDYRETFKNDTIKSTGDAAQLPLIETLVSNVRKGGQGINSRGLLGNMTPNG